MPCIPDYDELRQMQAETGVTLWSTRLAELVPSYVRFLPVIEALLADDPALATREDAQRCVEFMRRMAVTDPTPGPSRDEGEATRLRRLAEEAESGLCDAGTLAWNAVKGKGARSAELEALLERHRQHREEDRQARLKQLRADVRSIQQDLENARSRNAATEHFPIAISRVEARIASIAALSVDAICSNRSAF